MPLPALGPPGALDVVLFGPGLRESMTSHSSSAVRTTTLSPATGNLTLTAARAATKIKTPRLPKGLRVEAVLDSGRVEECWIWASFDQEGKLIGIRHGKDAAVVTP